MQPGKRQDMIGMNNLKAWLQDGEMKAGEWGKTKHNIPAPFPLCLLGLLIVGDLYQRFWDIAMISCFPTFYIFNNDRTSES